MIVLFEKDATPEQYENPNNHGICVLSPSSCVVTEIAGGQYELELEHPLDENHKYMMLTEERIIKAPVPKTVIPETVMPELKVWRVNESGGTDLYSKTPSSTYKNKNWKTIKKVKDNPLSYAYSLQKYYNYGSIALFGNTVYTCIRACFLISPTNPFYWSALGTLNDAEPTYNAGTIIEHLDQNTMIYKVADKGSWMQVRTVGGKVGFVSTNDCAETTEREQETIPEKTITEQAFRIYETACDEETNTYTVRAKHISYDYMSNCLYDCKVTEATPGEAIAAIQGSVIVDDDRRIACNITSETISQDWSFKNPVSALLDPDNGLVGKLDARLVRDNNDFYILNASNNRRGITIAYGVNMLGVNWTRSIENVITRIIPRSGSSDKGYKYISNGGRISGSSVQDQGKDYVESSIADQYEITRVSVLNCSYSVGQEYEASDGTKKTYTESEVLEKMLTDAKEKFTKDKVDGVDITLEVEFLLLGDTEEYKQYKDLQWVSLYDVIKVKTGKSMIDAEAQVTEYEYDCLRGRYNSIKLGTVNTFNKRIAGYRFINGSITYDKLSPDLINRIVTANASSTTDSGSAGDTPSGGGEIVVESNTVSADGIVTKGQGQVNKVWKTDENGNPAWRDEAGKKVLTSPSELGLASSDLTIAGIVSATPNGSIVVLSSDCLASAEKPAANGTLVINRANVARVSIEFFGKAESHGDYRMFLNNSTNAPTGTWIPMKYFDVEDSLSSTSTTDALSANQGHTLNQKVETILTMGTATLSFDSNGYAQLTQPDSDRYPILVMPQESTAKDCHVVCGPKGTFYAYCPQITSKNRSAYILWARE